MKSFRVSLTRVYSVEIVAEDEDKVRELAEFYIGDPTDASLPDERAKENFSIGEIELMLNDATEVEEI